MITETINGIEKTSERVIMGDTDSVFFKAQDLLSNPAECKTIVAEIVLSINKILHRTLPKQLCVTCDEIILRMTPSMSKKSYYRLEQNLFNFQKYHFSMVNEYLQKVKPSFIATKEDAEMLKSVSLVVKGISWSSMNQFL